MKKQNKLPRKRKKAFKKAHGPGNYMAFQIINELAFEENGYSDWRFPKYMHDGNKHVFVKNW